MNIFSKQVSNEDTFPIHAGIQALDLRGHNGTITWFPIDEGQPRVVARKEVRGMKLDLITEFLAEMKVVDSGTNGEMILWVDGPDRHTFAVFSTQVHFSVFA